MAYIQSSPIRWSSMIPNVLVDVGPPVSSTLSLVVEMVLDLRCTVFIRH